MKPLATRSYRTVPGEFYGTPRRYVEQELDAGHDVVLNIDIQGGDSVKKLFPNALMVFILPPSFETLEARMRKRGDLSEASIRTRLENARQEITASERYDYVVVNDTVEGAVAELAAIVVAERCRRKRKTEDFIGRITG